MSFTIIDWLLNCFGSALNLMHISVRGTEAPIPITNYEIADVAFARGSTLKCNI